MGIEQDFKSILEPNLVAFWNNRTPINFLGMDNTFTTVGKDEFINVSFLNVGSDRVIFGSATPFEATKIWQININIRKSQGALFKAGVFADVLIAEYTESIINGVVFGVVEVASHFEDNDFVILPVAVTLNKAY